MRLVEWMMGLSRKHYMPGQFITGAWLEERGACKPQVELFEEVYPEGVELTPDECAATNAHFDLMWLSNRLDDEGMVTSPMPRYRLWREDVYWMLNRHATGRPKALGIALGLPKWAVPVAMWVGLWYAARDEAAKAMARSMTTKVARWWALPMVPVVGVAWWVLRRVGVK